MAKGDKLSFVSSKTEIEAKNIKTGGAIHFTKDTHSIFMDGIEYGGLTDAQENYLNTKVREQVISNLTIEINSNKLIYPKNDGTLEAMVHIKYLNQYETPKTMTYTINNNTYDSIVENPSTGKYVIKIPENINSNDINIAVSVEYSHETEGIINKSAVYTIYIRPNVLHCWANVEFLDVNNIATVCKNNHNIIGFETNDVSLSAKGTYTWINKSEGYYYLLIPSSVDIPSSLLKNPPQGIEGPLPVYFVRQLSDVTYKNILYRIFRIVDKQIASIHTIIFD